MPDRCLSKYLQEKEKKEGASKQRHFLHKQNFLALYYSYLKSTLRYNGMNAQQSAYKYGLYCAVGTVISGQVGSMSLQEQ